LKKTIFCVVMLISCIVASAQQKPSFRDYLRNNQGLPVISNPAVRAIPPFNKFDNSIHEKKSVRGNGMSLNDAKLLKILLPNGNKLYELPMDKMICVVPDMSQFHMPVVISGSDFGDKKINLLDTE